MHTRHAFALLLVFVSIIGAPCANSQQGSVLGPRVGSPDVRRPDIEGTVVNSVTGEPIRHALVTLSGSSRTAFTDDQGHFSFAAVPRGFLALQAQRPGFSTPNDRPQMVDISKSTVYEIKLIPTSVIYGRIIGAHNDPLERAMVHIFKSQLSNGRRQWTEVGGTATDEDGAFRIPSLAPGNYKVSAGPVYPTDLGSLDAAYRVTFYPDSPDRNSAPPVQLLPGQQLELNFKLNPAQAFNVSGTIVGAADSMNASIDFLDGSNTPLTFPFRFDPATGAFEIRNVPSGHYMIRATTWGNRQVMRARQPINVSANITGLTLALQQPSTIPVVYRTFFTKQTTPLRDQVMQGMLAQVRLTATDETSNYFVQPEGPPANRTFTIKGVEPGAYNVELTPAGPWYVASAQSGSRDLLRETLVVPPGGNVEPIEITLRDDAATLQGSVRNVDAPGELIVVSDTDPNRHIRGGYGPDGGFYVPPCAPGAYTIYAFDHPDAVEYSNPDVLRDYRSRATHVTLSPNQTTKVTVDLIGAEQ